MPQKNNVITPVRNWRDRLLLVFKGMAMGMANKIPGVSGGIIALAAGFYEELIYSFSRFDAKALQMLFKGFCLLPTCERSFSLAPI